MFKSSEKASIDREIDIGARNIGADTEYGNTPNKFNKDKFGICHDCKYLRAAITQYGRTFAMCDELDIKLNGMDPITNCSEYAKRGSMTLWEMKEIAIILEPFRKQAGFILEERDEENDGS